MPMTGCEPWTSLFGSNLSTYWATTTAQGTYCLYRLSSGHWSYAKLDQEVWETLMSLGGGGGQVVSMLAFYFHDPSSNPAEVYSFYSLNCLKRTKINKTRPGMAHF